MNPIGNHPLEETADLTDIRVWPAPAQRRLLDRIGVREVAVTAKKEGKIEGKDEKEIEIIIAMDSEGFEIERIARI